VDGWLIGQFDFKIALLNCNNIEPAFLAGSGLYELFTREAGFCGNGRFQAIEHLNSPI